MEDATTEEEDTGIPLPQQIINPMWAMSADAITNTMTYIFDVIRHPCYLVGVKKRRIFWYKLQPGGGTAPEIIPVLREELARLAEKPHLTPNQVAEIRKAIQVGETRVMQCIVKTFAEKPETPNEYFLFLKQFAQGLDDGLYIFNLTDAVILRADGNLPFVNVYGLKPIPLPPEKRHPMLPILGAGQIGYLDIPIPNYDEIMRALEGNYPKGYETTWAKKMAKAVFRGGPSGCGATAETNMRVALALKKSPLIDACIVGRGANVIKFDPKIGLAKMNLAEVSRAQCAAPMSMENQSRYKYIIHVDGNVNAYRLLGTMLTGSLILRVKSPYIHWADHILKPGEHYLEVSRDLSNLDALLAWCLKHDEKCRKIAANGRNAAIILTQRDTLIDVFAEYLNTLDLLKSDSPSASSYGSTKGIAGPFSVPSATTAHTYSSPFKTPTGAITPIGPVPATPSTSITPTEYNLFEPQSKSPPRSTPSPMGELFEPPYSSSSITPSTPLPPYDSRSPSVPSATSPITPPGPYDSRSPSVPSATSPITPPGPYDSRSPSVPSATSPITPPLSPSISSMTPPGPYVSSITPNQLRTSLQAQINTSVLPSPAAKSQTPIMAANASPVAKSQTPIIAANASPAAKSQTPLIAANASPVAKSQTPIMAANASPVAKSQTPIMAANTSPVAKSQTPIMADDIAGVPVTYGAITPYESPDKLHVTLTPHIDDEYFRPSPFKTPSKIKNANTPPLADEYFRPSPFKTPSQIKNANTPPLADEYFRPSPFKTPSEIENDESTINYLPSPYKSPSSPSINYLPSPYKSPSSPSINYLPSPYKSPLSPSINYLPSPYKSPLSSRSPPEQYKSLSSPSLRSPQGEYKSLSSPSRSPQGQYKSLSSPSSRSPPGQYKSLSSPTLRQSTSIIFPSEIEEIQNPEIPEPIELIQEPQINIPNDVTPEPIVRPEGYIPMPKSNRCPAGYRRIKMPDGTWMCKPKPFNMMNLIQPFVPEAVPGADFKDPILPGAFFPIAPPQPPAEVIEPSAAVAPTPPKNVEQLVKRVANVILNENAPDIIPLNGRKKCPDGYGAIIIDSRKHCRKKTQRVVGGNSRRHRHKRYGGATPHHRLYETLNLTTVRDKATAIEIARGILGVL